MSIIFYLDKTLKIYQVSDSVKLIKTVVSDKGYLDLYNKFEFVYSDLLADGLILNTSEIHFWLSPRASFTDTRVVYIWLRSRLIFTKGLYYIMKLEEHSGVGDVTKNNIIGLLAASKSLDNKDLVYSKEPNIGKK